MNIFFNFLVDKSKLFIFFLSVLSLISLLGLPKFQLDASSDTLLLDNDPDLKTYRENSRKYGSSDFLVIAFTPNKDIFTIETISLLKNLVEDLKGLTEKLHSYNPSFYRLVHTADEVWNTNWKCLVENFMEGYHLSVVHPKTLHGYTPTELSKKGPSGLGFTSYTAHYPDHISSRGRGSDKLSESERHASFLFAAFPCQVVSIAPPLLVSLSLLPRSSSRVDVRWTMSVYGEELDAQTIDARIALWTEVNREDREKLELMQEALGSRYANGGPLAGPDYEGTVRDFVVWLASRDKEIQQKN